MKVIKNNLNAEENSDFPRVCKCFECDSEIEIEEEDLEEMPLNERLAIGYYCPVCGEWNTLKLTELHTWPKSFYHFGAGAGAKTVDDSWTQRFVKDIAKLLDKSKPGDAFETGTGDTIVIGKRYEDCKKIIVAKNYWEQTYDLTD